MIMDLYRKPIVNITISKELLNSIPSNILGKRKGRMSALSTSFQDCIQVSIQCNKAKKKLKRKSALFIDNNYPCRNPKKSTKHVLQLISLARSQDTRTIF